MNIGKIILTIQFMTKSIITIGVIDDEVKHFHQFIRENITAIMFTDY